MKEDLLKIINHYGTMAQLKYFQSEVFELNEAIIRHNEIEDSGLYRSSDECFAKEHIKEEVADVLVMLFQFMYYYGIDLENTKKIMFEKIARQLKRIKEEEKWHISNLMTI